MNEKIVTFVGCKGRPILTEFLSSVFKLNSKLLRWGIGCNKDLQN